MCPIFRSAAHLDERLEHFERKLLVPDDGAKVVKLVLPFLQILEPEVVLPHQLFRFVLSHVRSLPLRTGVGFWVRNYGTPSNERAEARIPVLLHLRSPVQQQEWRRR